MVAEIIIQNFCLENVCRNYNQIMFSIQLNFIGYFRPYRPIPLPSSASFSSINPKIFCINKFFFARRYHQISNIVLECCAHKYRFTNCYYCLPCECVLVFWFGIFIIKIFNIDCWINNNKHDTIMQNNARVLK